MYLMHYGIKGMKWGVRRTPEQLGHYKRSAKQLSKSMRSFKYKEFDKLMSPEEVKRSKRGSCHDQVMYELDYLRKAGYKPRATFLIEYDDNGQGGMTHSFVHYQKNGKTYWVENAWMERSGITAYDSLNDIKKAIRRAHKTGEFGNKKRYSHLAFAKFDDRKHRPGESLQELVYKCFRS